MLSSIDQKMVQKFGGGGDGGEIKFVIFRNRLNSCRVSGQIGVRVWHLPSCVSCALYSCVPVFRSRCSSYSRSRRASLLIASHIVSSAFLLASFVLRCVLRCSSRVIPSHGHLVAPSFVAFVLFVPSFVSRSLRACVCSLRSLLRSHRCFVRYSYEFVQSYCFVSVGFVTCGSWLRGR